MALVLLVLAIVLRVLSNPLGNVFQKKLTSKGQHPLMVNFVSYLAASFACIVLALFIQWPVLMKEFWTYSVLAGMVGATGNGFLVKALQKGDLSVLGPINAYKSVVAVLVGIFLLREIPGLWGIAGMALIIFGSYFVLDTTEEGFSWELFKKREIQYRLWAMILTAIEAVFIKKIILSSSPTVAFFSWCWFGSFFSLVLLLFYGRRPSKELKRISRNDLTKYVLLVLCIGAMQYTTNYTLSNLPVGYALALFQLSIIVSVVLGHSIFKEKGLYRKLIGSVIMVAGSILLILVK